MERGQATIIANCNGHSPTFLAWHNPQTVGKFCSQYEFCVLEMTRFWHQCSAVSSLMCSVSKNSKLEIMDNHVWKIVLKTAKLISKQTDQRQTSITSSSCSDNSPSHFSTNDSAAPFRWKCSVQFHFFPAEYRVSWIETDDVTLRSAPHQTMVFSRLEYTIYRKLIQQQTMQQLLTAGNFAKSKSKLLVPKK